MSRVLQRSGHILALDFGRVNFHETIDVKQLNTNGPSIP